VGDRRPYADLTGNWEAGKLIDKRLSAVIRSRMQADPPGVKGASLISRDSVRFAPLHLA
jgi:hypothetical protein